MSTRHTEDTALDEDEQQADADPDDGQQDVAPAAESLAITGQLRSTGQPRSTSRAGVREAQVGLPEPADRAVSARSSNGKDLEG
ncbi:hypothetical protein ACWCXX_37280 [Streptomyces sp. NPDC001732]